ncbi:DUF222 domain-containing protein [Microbacteriaceae bacterium VKM Ac-2855]|nr:DUF222 domain-containing protein [Microbacteriaceae bacterium VKM Ac-2855]
MEDTSSEPTPDEVRDTVRQHGDRAAHLARSTAPALLAGLKELYAGYLVARSRPELFAAGKSLARGDLRDLVERSIRAEFAVALGVSEWVASRELERAQLLVEDLPLTRAALADARMRWDAGQVICDVAGGLDRSCRAALDERAVELAGELTPAQLKKALQQLREILDETPLAERHAAAKTRRNVWVTPEQDGMATLSALLPAPVAVAAFNRLDRIARAARDLEGEERSLSQLRADAAGDLLCDGDVAGTTPIHDDTTPTPTFVRGIRAEVRVTLPATTAAGLDDAHGHLDGYGVIDADTARELVAAGDAFFRVFTDPVTCMVTSVERMLRTPPKQMRLFIELRADTCMFPGCIRPASKAEIDHAIEWRNGGHTATKNLLPLCVAHHHVRHGDRWTYIPHPDGTADWTPPTGRQVTTRPAPVPGARPAPRFTDSSSGPDPEQPVSIFDPPPPDFGPTPF